MTDETAPRILIEPTSAIGDAILTLPVACALREHFPSAYLAWVVEKKAAPMVRNHPALDHVIELERGWFTSPRQIRSAREELRSQRFDVTIDCQALTKSAMACWLTGAEKRIGFAGSHGGELSRLLNNTLVKPVFKHLTDRSLELLIPLDVHSPRVHWKLPIDESARVWAARWRRTVSCQSLALLNPGAKLPSKQWESSRFASTARYLQDRYDHRSVVVWDTPAERLLAEAIVKQSEGAATLAPDTDLHHLAALIETAQLLISVENGSIHLGAALGTPSIGLYGAARPEISVPYRQTVLHQPPQKRNARRRRSRNDAAMRAISAMHVCQAIDKIQQERRMMRAA